MSAPGPYSPSFEPLFLALGALAGALYWRASRRERVPRWRAFLFGAGLLLVAGSVNSPLETIATSYLVLVHLLQNVILADWAPPLLLLGLTPSMRAAIACRGGRALAALTRPRVALPVWLAGWYVIHLAAVYDTALRNQWLLNVEHATLVAIGLVFWWPVLSDAPRRVSTPARIGYLFAGFVGSAFLGLALTFAGSALYDTYQRAPRLWGLSPVEDQNLGGVLMTAEQALVFLLAIGYFVLRLLGEEEEREAVLAEHQGREHPLSGGDGEDASASFSRDLPS
ncbi:MAG: cytochrome c oxidase assembly protein [Thermoleophilia bacterium]|nr:cytochrome c oxidase assembly protein [Thermoleophilia bacterium]